MTYWLQWWIMVLFFAFLPGMGWCVVIEIIARISERQRDHQ